MSPLEPKLIYVARRNPTLSRAEFMPRWRQHGALGMALPRWKNIARYVQCDVLPASRVTAALDGEPDGIGIVWHRSAEALAAHIADTISRDAMERDELETFDRPVVQSCIVTREVALVPPPGASGGNTSPVFKITRLVTAGNRAHGTDLARHRKMAGAAMSQRLRRAGIELLGYVVNTPLPPEGGSRWGLDVDCIEELWFGDIESAVRASEHLAADSQFDVATGVTYGAAATQILSNEVVIYQE